MNPGTLFKSALAASLLIATTYAGPHERDDRDGRDYRSSKHESSKQEYQTVKKVVPLTHEQREHYEERSRDRYETQERHTVRRAKTVRERTYEAYRPAYRYTPPPAVPLIRSRPYSWTHLPVHRRPGYILHTVPSLALTLTVGGLVYFYHDHLFYRHYPRGYVVVVPPIGALVPTLPVGYVVVYRFGRYYYVYENTYYVWDDGYDAYRIVEAPEAVAEEDFDAPDYEAGEIVRALPDGAEAVTVGGVQYYRWRDVHFLPSAQNGKVVYIVVKLK